MGYQAIKSRGSNNIISVGEFTVSSPDRVVIIAPRYGQKKVVPFHPKMRGKDIDLVGSRLVIDGFVLQEDHTWYRPGAPRRDDRNLVEIIWTGIMNWLKGGKK